MTSEPALLAEEGAADAVAAATGEAAGAGLVRAATIIAAGNVASRALGLARETVIAYLFGATGYVSVFRVAATIIQSLYDFLVGGMVSAALVPVFSELADRKNRDDLWRTASVIFSGIAVVLALAVLLLEIFAPQIVWLLGSGYDPSLQDAAVGMVRLILPAVFFLGMSGLLTGLLYALKRFTYPAFTSAAYNAGIVVVSLALSPIFGITSLIVGILVGSALQVILQVPGLRDVRYRVTLDLSHPALRKIGRLYAPVLAGLCISTIGVVIDRNLASHTGAQSLAWMQAATTLTQFPLGLVSTAISFAILPELSRAAAETESAAAVAFQSTLAFGIKLILLLILPAAVGLFVLAQPIVALLYEHGAFTAADTFWTSTALRFYLIGLPFAAIDYPLVFAFYARKNTLTPNLVAFAGVSIYIVVALALVGSFGMIGLVTANSAQLTGHALIMIWLTQTRLGGLSRQAMLSTTLKIVAASAVMGFAAYVLLGTVGGGASPHWLQVAVPTLAAILVYVFLVRVLRIREADRVWQMVRNRLGIL